MNPSTLVILNLLGGVALLLWGVRMVRTGILRVWEDQLKYFIEYRLGNRFSALIAGLLATLVLGSGTATALIVTNIASTGALPAGLGLSVLLGADAGSSLIAALVASGSNIALWTSPVFLFLGYVIFQSSEELKPHNAGRVLIGLGLMLLSLRLISQATTPLGEASLFHQVLAAVGQAKLRLAHGQHRAQALHIAPARAFRQQDAIWRRRHHGIEIGLDKAAAHSVDAHIELFCRPGGARGGDIVARRSARRGLG